jgi:hypothetical protein
VCNANPVLCVFRFEPARQDQGGFDEQELSVIIGRTVHGPSVRNARLPKACHYYVPDGYVGIMSRQLEEQPHNEPLVVHAVAGACSAPKVWYRLLP